MVVQLCDVDTIRFVNLLYHCHNGNRTSLQYSLLTVEIIRVNFRLVVSQKSKTPSDIIEASSSCSRHLRDGSDFFQLEFLDDL